jgi:AraC-like DNA-binding protein
MTISMQDDGVVDAALVTVFRAGLGRRVPYGYIRIGPGIAIPAVLHDFNVAIEPLLRRVGVPGDLFADPDNALPYRDFCQLLSLCVEAIKRDDFGLLICEKTGASNLGLVGFLLQQAPDVRTALGDLVRYLHHNDRGAVPFMTIAGGMVTLGYQISEPDMPAAEHVYDGALAIGRNIMRAFCGPNWTPIEVTLSRKRPISATRHERFYGAPVRFGAERSALFFREEWLDTPIHTADPMLRRMLQEQVDLLEIEEAGNVTEQVRRLLRTSLLTSGTSLGDLSELLQMNRRTLARHLDAEGTSFKKISDEVHFDVARHLLANTSMSVTDVSLALNYSETSSFTRAFRGWAGLAPTEWRAMQGAGKE